MSIHRLTSCFRFRTSHRGSEIAYGNAKEISLYFHSSDRGRFQDRLELGFYDSAHAKRFAITRTLLCIVGNREDFEAIKPSAPYKPRQKKAREAVGTIDDGPKPPAIASIKWEVELKLYNVPKELERVLKMDDKKAKLKSLRVYMPREFTCETYTRQFHTLLHTEEHRAAYVRHMEGECLLTTFLAWTFNDTMKRRLHWSHLQERTSTSALKWVPSDSSN